MSSKKDMVIGEALTFDDVLLVPLESHVLPREVDLKTKLTKKLTLNIPMLSSAMDTVTEHEMAIAMAVMGGAGVIHKNLTIERQVEEVKLVKAYKLTDEDKKAAALDEKNTLMVGAAVSTGDDTVERVQALIDVGASFIVVDSAHGHSEGIINKVKELRKQFPDLNIVAGNTATKEAAQALVEAGADCIKVGIGPGSICTTRIVAGVGVPQITAAMDTFDYCDAKGIPFIVDGGIQYSGDIVKALAAGGNLVMCGGILAGTDEAPGDVITMNDKKVKTYVGMGSLAAMKRGSSDRYFQKGAKKLVPEGVESVVPYKGSVKEVVFQLLGGLRAGMGYNGAATIDELRHKAKFVKITNAGLKESHPHDVMIAKEAPNYHVN